MANVTLLYRNILETGTVTSVDENPSFPRYRLYDRDIAKLFKFNSHPANLTVTINQTPIIYPVDRLIIPGGHTLNGLDIILRYSDTGAWGGEEVTVVNWTQGDWLVINKTFTQQTRQYWQFLITSNPAAPPEFAEMFLGADLVFTRNPDPSVMEGRKRYVTRQETLSGKSQRIKFGESKRSRRYSLKTVASAQKADFEAWEALCEGLKPFYIIDHNGTLIYMEMLNELEFNYITPTIVSTSLELLEVL